MLNFNAIAFAIFGGIIPPLVWLFFWLREDKIHPEPKKTIAISFLFGMIAVVVVIPFEQIVKRYIGSFTVMILLWAVVEELFKYGAGYLGGLRSKAYDEPIDPMIYLITAALGFSALENILFLLDPVVANGILTGFITGNIRFIGATLLHTISSGAIGLAIALSFYKNLNKKILYRAVGVASAILIHFLFNIFVIGAKNGGLFIIFAFVWLAVIFLLLFFEKVKRLKKLN